MPLPEKTIISRLRRLVKGGRGVVAGIGDDCAVLGVPAGHEILVTTDFTLEGTHFRRDWHPPESVGHRCLARGLSDIAAMGGRPVAAFLSLALPKDLPQRWVDGFFRGFLRLAKRFSVPLAGGDTAESQTGVLADVIVLGSVPKRESILRSGARPGDLIYVSGQLGGSAAALQGLRRGKKLRPRSFPRHFFPEPRITVGQALSERHLATAMIDLSDGLSTDLTHICEESGVGAEIRAAAIPLARFGKAHVDLRLALHGGEDYELLFTAPPGKRVPASIADVPITQIGKIIRGRSIFLVGADSTKRPLPPQGWEHFRK